MMSYLFPHQIELMASAFNLPLKYVVVFHQDHEDTMLDSKHDDLESAITRYRECVAERDACRSYWIEAHLGGSIRAVAQPPSDIPYKDCTIDIHFNLKDDHATST